MKPNDRARLTTALRDHVAKIAADLRAKMRAPGDTRARAQQLHADEQVAEDFDVWTDLLSRRAAVLWVLKSVYVRVLEDRGLLAPGRLLDLEAQQLFERLAPHLGETAFLRWVYRDLASPRGGLPELFSPQPAEVAYPSDELSRGLIAFWRHRDADTGSHWSFAEERFEGELMGDLYQELDPVVKDRFALCQTPDFVRTFILDRTLTPAIETFGAEEVRLLDPACGSGHFLIDGLKRLVAATTAMHPDWERGKVVAHVLDRVVGVDLNDYACALARARLIMTAAELAGVTSLADAARFHPHVYWADGLEQVERDELKPSLQFSLLETVEEKPRAILTRSDVRAALKKVFATKFHAVTANPPYILESDDARKAYHREKVRGRRRYVSSSGKYSLSAPFIERCLQLVVPSGFLGIIASNNFMKRTFGKALVEEVLSGLDLTMVIDAAHAYIPFHGTPTVLLFGIARPPSGDRVRTVMGKRGQTGVPEDPAKGLVWAGVLTGWEQPGYQDDYVSVADLDPDLFSRHPWSLGSADAIDLKARVEDARKHRLGEICSSIGYSTICGGDSVFVADSATHVRRRVSEIAVPFVTGHNVRDWRIDTPDQALFPYEGLTGPVLSASNPRVRRAFWRYKVLLQNRTIFGQTPEQKGMRWYEHMYRDVAKLRSPLSLTFSFVATHNHFCMDHGGKLYNVHAPVVKLREPANEDDYLITLAVLNSSTACFWMKQVFQPKGATSANRNHPDPERFAHEFASTGMLEFPLPNTSGHEALLLALSRRLTSLGAACAKLLQTPFVDEHLTSAPDLRAALDARWRAYDDARQQMVFAQEEIDWLVYYLFGLTEDRLFAPSGEVGRLPRGQRAFERTKGRRSFVRVGGQAVRPEDAEAETGPTALPANYSELTAKRESAIAAQGAINLLESYMYKRLWRGTEDNVPEAEYRRRLDSSQMREWLFNRIEVTAGRRTVAVPAGRLATDLMDDRLAMTVAEVLTGSQSFSLDALVAEILASESVPSHRFHTYTDTGLEKARVWEEVWELQRKQDEVEHIETVPTPPEYSQGSRGKSTDYLRNECWKLRGKLDVPKERFIAFTEVPGRAGVETLYGWAGWAPLQRLKAILAIDEELEDAGVLLADRIGLLDSAWRLLRDVASDDAAAATRLKAELQSLVGPDGPSRELIEGWRKRFPPPNTRASRAKRSASVRENEEVESEESDES